MRKIPELLSPVGTAPAMVAAVQCGADAIYLGAGDFNARKNAENFGGELESAVGYCHARGTQVYVTLNTMVRQDELSRLEKTIEEICLARADGVIVQDLGVARAIAQMSPTLKLHASTQMAVHNPQGVEFLVKNGFSRVVMAREMEFEEIVRCANLGAELEVFIHGALCVSCSGQCLMSSMIGGRSGNRGLCAQPCRMKYRMDEKEGYLLSTKDLCSAEHIQELIQAGADSLKIEGRLKRPEYVAQTTAAYRRLLNDIRDGKSTDTAALKAELRQMFNRGGFTAGYGFGVEDRELMFSKKPNHMGVEVGISRKNGEIQLHDNIDAKDALALLRGTDAEIPVHMNACAKGNAPLSEARKGDVLVRLVSQAQMKAAQDSFCGEFRKFPVSAILRLKIGENASLSLSDGVHRAFCEGDIVQRAQSKPTDPERIHLQIEKLGDTPFEIRSYSAEIDADAFAPISAINALRRRAAELLIEKRFGNAHPCSPLILPEQTKIEKTRPELLCQSADPSVLQRALDSGADFAVFAPEDLRIASLNASLNRLQERFDLALPPVMTEKTLSGVNAWANGHGDRIRRVLINNISQLAPKWNAEIVGDMFMNIANALSAAQLQDWNVNIITPSIELNRAQIEAFPARRQLIVYGRIPLMQLRHCPLRAANGIPGKHKFCRRCDESSECINAKELIDRTGAHFPLRRIASDDGCVIQLLNSAKLMLLRKCSALPTSEAWRMLMTADDPIETVTALHRAAIDGKDPRKDALWSEIERINTTTGHYFRGAE